MNKQENKWHKFDLSETISSEENVFIVKCKYQAALELCVAYMGDNGFFYSMESHAMLPVIEWAFMPDYLNNT